MYKVRWIKANPEAFIKAYLSDSRVEIATGRRVLAARLSGESKLVGEVKRVRELRQGVAGGSSDILLGREPTWADVINGYTSRLSSVDALRGAISNPRSPIVLVHGTAGCGKSTSLMQLALELDADGATVVWIDRSVELSVGAILDRVRSLTPSYVFVDNVDVYGIFGARVVEILRRLSNVTTVVAAVRSSLLGRLDLETDAVRFRIPDLSDPDIWAILDNLERQGLLGELRGMAVADRFRRLAEDGRRQLLVALMEATKGKRFGTILENEYNQLSPEQQTAYGLASVVGGLNEEGISQRELDLAVGGFGSAVKAAVDDLLDGRILVRAPGGLLSPRHRLIGERVVRYLAREGQLAEVVEALVVVLAVSAKDTTDVSRRDRRLLIRLLNHDQLVSFGLEVDAVRSIYGSVQFDLYDDFHFWLQRGAYELQTGDLELALNYLSQARLAEGGHDDPYVLTEFSLARLRAAMSLADSRAAAVLGGEALVDLETVIRRMGRNSPHSFVVLADAGVKWLGSAELTAQEAESYTDKIRALLDLHGGLAEESEYVRNALRRANARLDSFSGRRP